MSALLGAEFFIATVGNFHLGKIHRLDHVLTG